MPDPQRLIEQRRARLGLAGSALRSGLRQTLRDAAATQRERRARLSGLAAQLESVSPQAVLARGYVLVRDEAGHAVTLGAALKPGTKLGLTFADAVRDVRVERDRPAQGALGL
jgi:exodeoxyribonuclease VII large subunit